MPRPPLTTMYRVDHSRSFWLRENGIILRALATFFNMVNGRKIMAVTRNLMPKALQADWLRS